MDYYGSIGNDAKFTLKDRKGKKLAKVGGKTKRLYPFTPKNPSRFEYPSYNAITVNGITDIIEHKRMEPIFYVTDDPAVWKALSNVSAPKP